MPFNVTQRQVIVFTAGIALGVAVAWAVFGRHSGAEKDLPKATLAAGARAANTPVAIVVGACAFPPVVTTAASDDGRVQVHAELAGRGAKQVDAWILNGKEAVAAGRQKDAESDFLMACRAAENLGASGAMPQAEAMYHLGRHYAGLAGAAAPSRSDELWRRAESLFAASLQTYNARYGDASDKTRFAAKGLAEAREHTGGTPAVAAAPEPAKPAAEAKVAKATPPPPASVKPPKESAPAPAQVAVPAPAPKQPLVKSAAPKQAEPAVAVAAPAPPKATEPPVAVVRPKPPKPRPAPAPVQDTEEHIVMEPPARAVGSATGHTQGESAATQ